MYSVRESTRYNLTHITNIEEMYIKLECQVVGNPSQRQQTLKIKNPKRHF